MLNYSIFVVVFLFGIITIPTIKADNPIQWTMVNSSNAASFAELYFLWNGGGAFQFTESMNYTINTTTTLIDGEELYLSTAPGIMVTFDIPKDNHMINQEGGFLGIKGDFLFQGSSVGESGIAITGGSANIEGVRFQNFGNTHGTVEADRFYGPLNVINGHLYLSSSAIVDGKDSASIWITDGNVTLHDVLIEENQNDNDITNTFGAQIIIDGNGLLTVSNSRFNQNSGMTASAIYNNGGSVTLNQIIIQDSETTEQLGAQIYNENGLLTVSNSTFKRNTGAIAAAIYNVAGVVNLNEVAVEDSTLTTNIDTNHGQLYNQGGKMSGSGITFSGNSDNANFYCIDGCFYDSSQDIKWINVDSSNAPSWDDFYNLWENNQQDSFPGVAFKFTENLSYTVTSYDMQINGVNLLLATDASKGITVSILVPDEAKMIQQSNAYLGIDGNFVIQGNPSCTTWQEAITVNGGTTEITGIIIQEFVSPTPSDSNPNIGALTLNSGNVTILSTTFTKCKGTMASAIYNAGATVTLGNVTVEESNVIETASGAQFYITGGSMSTSMNSMYSSTLIFDNNIGANYRCKVEAECSLPPQQTPSIIVDSSNGANWEDFYQLWQDTYTYLGGVYKFTENVTYTVTEPITITTGGNLELSVASVGDIIVNINVPNNMVFLTFDETEPRELIMNGSFVIQGDSTCTTSCQQQAINLNGHVTARIEGLIIQDFVNDNDYTKTGKVIVDGAVTINGANVQATFLSTDFQNNKGYQVSAIYNNGGNVILHNVIVKDSTVTNYTEGAQLYTVETGEMSGNVSFSNNEGPNYRCGVNALCSLPPQTIPTIVIDSSNGATWEDFYKLWNENSFPGVSFQFAQSVTYTITNEGLLNAGNLYLSTTSTDIKVTINVPNENVFITQSEGHLSIKGDFVIQGNASCTSSCNQQALLLNYGSAEIEGVTLKSFTNIKDRDDEFDVSSAIINNHASVFFNLTSFSNCKGNRASVLYNEYGSITFENVIVKDCIVIDFTSGGQLYNMDGYMAGSNISFHNNKGVDYVPSYVPVQPGSTRKCDLPLQYVTLDSYNASTFDDFYDICTITSAAAIGAVFEFTETVTYDISKIYGSIGDPIISTGYYETGHRFSLIAAEGVTIEINLYRQNFLSGLNAIRIIGDFVISGGKAVHTENFIEVMNTDIYLEGLTLKNFVNKASQSAAIKAAGSEGGVNQMTIVSTTFLNCTGKDATAFYGQYGEYILHNITIKDCEVISSHGGQLYVENSYMDADNVTTINNEGALYGCPGSTCSVSLSSSDENDDNWMTPQPTLSPTPSPSTPSPTSSRTPSPTPKSMPNQNDDDDDSNDQWINVDSNNGATWDDFYQLWQRNALTAEGDSFMFTESLTYTVGEEQGLLISGEQNVRLSTSSSDITVTINVPDGTFFLEQNGDTTLEMNGDFIIQGEQGEQGDNSAPFFLFNNANNNNLNGITIQNYNSATQAAVVIVQGTMTLTSTIFNNCNGPMASAIFQANGKITFNDVTVESSSVSSNDGAQLYSFAGTMSGSVTFENNQGSNYLCAEDATCSISATNTSGNNPSSHAGKTAAIVVPIIIVLCACAGGVFWLDRNKRKGKREPLLGGSLTSDQVQREGSIQSQHQQF